MEKRKKIISLIVVLLVAVTCYGIYYFFTGTVNVEDTGYKDVFECSVADIAEYSVDDGENSYSIVKNNGEWVIRGNDTAILDQEKVNELLGNVSIISVHDVDSDIDEDEFADMKRKKVIVGLVNGENIVIEFAALEDKTCAVRISGEDEIYLAHLSLMDILTVKAENLRMPLLFEDLEKSGAVITYYHYTDYDDSKISLRQKGSSEFSSDCDNMYIMDEPYYREVDDELFEQQIAVNIPTLSAKSYVDEPSDNLADYGLDAESRAELRFGWEKGEEVLFLGKAENGLVYAQKNGTDGIFLIGAPKLQFLNTEPFYILEKSVLKYNAEIVSGIHVLTQGKEYDIRRVSVTTDVNEYTVGGKIASEYSYKLAVDKLAQIEICSELLSVPLQNGTITVRISYDKGYQTQIISFVPLNDMEYAMFVNNTAEFAVDKESVDSFISELETISKNPMQTGEKG